MIEVQDVSFAYRTGEADAVPALRDLNLEIEPGQLVAVIGHNGSGKSTLAKLLCAVLYPTEGEIRIDGVPVREENQWEVRRRVAVVFQDPDDQLVMNRVEDDVAFGPENLGLPREEIAERVGSSLEALGLEKIGGRLIEDLSPGQKQRVRALVRFGQATALPRAARLDLAEEVLALSQKLELPSLAIGAHTLYAQRLLTVGDSAGARSHTREAVTLMDTYTSGYLYPGEVLLTHFQALRAADDPEARSALARALAFLTDTALPNVPESYQRSFLEGVVNREILAEAGRCGLEPVERPGREGL